MKQSAPQVEFDEAATFRHELERSSAQAALRRGRRVLTAEASNPASLTIEYPANGSFFRPQNTLVSLTLVRAEAEQRSVQGTIACEFPVSS